MDTDVIHVTDSTQHEAVNRAIDVLDGGGLVVFPTETVYGVGTRADRPDGVARLRAIKSRGMKQAFTVHAGSRQAAWELVPGHSGLAERLSRKAWPGPMTLVLPVHAPETAPIASRIDAAALKTLYHEGTVGIRVPAHDLATALLSGAGGPVVAASANDAGQPPPRDGVGAMEAMSGKVDLVLDGGGSRYAKPSTIVKVVGDVFEVLREGVFDFRAVSRLAMYKIVFICTGNTCRSPMAEGMAKHLIADQLGCRVEDLTDRGIIVESAGVAGGVGDASDHAREVMQARGIDLTSHRSRLLTADMVRQADAVVAMTEGHAQAARNLAPEADHVRLLLDPEEVQDPIGGSVEVYRQCADAIENGIKALLKEVPL